MKSKKPINIKSKIKSALRKIWSWYGENKKSALSRQKYITGYYRCQGCGCNTSKPQADHIKPVGLADNWDEYIDYLFQGDIQILCKKCHDSKTKTDNKNIRRLKK